MAKQSDEQANTRVTPEQYEELVRKVAERVWQALRHELRTASERRGMRGGRTR